MLDDDIEFVEDVLYSKLGYCSCAEDCSLDELIRVMDWLCTSGDNITRASYSDLYPQTPGVFYLLVSMLEISHLAGHGISQRCSRLTEYGKKFLTLLKEYRTTEGFAE